MSEADTGQCPCGSGRAYRHCCGPLHDGTAAAATAEALMRSRFSAFARGRADYLLSSWHPGTRPARLELDGQITWRRLQIVDTESGGADDDTGIVEFRAQYLQHGKRHILHERSRCSRARDGTWRYVDGDFGDGR
ncbi:YchJ family metal-binding protein [Mycobacterium sp. ITM-2016-00316]|uniref:YchJ family protein n=1 Tax=Mycobacterium sp. ITM-2016-00316 TaxID=2099695 RepID=UPI000CF88BBD|nr:YchJ family metal-binding protein [Mycobacterium sp. ITM-2016-00316]WNG83380.1 YchJ family metal-binding protein [Mycobacterium sp. ITM-2016-00316]